MSFNRSYKHQKPNFNIFLLNLPATKICQCSKFVCSALLFTKALLFFYWDDNTFWFQTKKNKIHSQKERYIVRLFLWQMLSVDYMIIKRMVGLYNMFLESCCQDLTNAYQTCVQHILYLKNAKETLKTSSGQPWPPDSGGHG